MRASFLKLLWACLGVFLEMAGKVMRLLNPSSILVLSYFELITKKQAKNYYSQLYSYLTSYLHNLAFGKDFKTFKNSSYPNLANLQVFDLFLSQYFSKGKWFKKCRIAIFGRNVIVMLKYVRKNDLKTNINVSKNSYFMLKPF